MIDINELRRLAQAVIGWGCCNQAWLDQSEDTPAAVVGHINEDGETYPVVTIDCDQYSAAGQSLPLGKFYAAANPAVINEILNRLEAAEEERDALRAKIDAMERQEPFDAEGDVFRSAFEAALKAGNWPATRQGDGYRSPSTQIAWRIAFSTVNRLKLYLAPGAQFEQKAVAYLDIGAGGYTDIGADLNDEQLASLPKGRHMLGIVGTYGVDGYVSAQPAPSALTEAIIADMQAQHDSELITENDSGEALIRLDGAIAAVEDNFALAQPAPSAPEGWKLVPIEPTPSVPTALLVAVADLVAQMEIISRVGFVDTPNDKDSCAAFCIAVGTWLELMSAVESLASALAAAPEAKP